MGPFRSLCVFMNSNGSLWVLIGFYAALCVFEVLIRFYGSLSVVIGVYASLWVLMSPYKSLCVLIDSNGYVWVCIILFAS